LFCEQLEVLCYWTKIMRAVHCDCEHSKLVIGLSAVPIVSNYRVSMLCCSGTFVIH